MATKVLWVTKGLAPGGAERLLCAAARTHDQEEFSFHCIFVDPRRDQLKRELEDAGVSVECVARSAADPLWPLRLWRVVRGGPWDVVHIHFPLPGAVARLAVRSLPRGRRPALVSTEHNQMSTYRRPTRWLTRLTGRWDDETITVSREVSNGLPSGQRRSVHHLVHGVEVDRIRATSADARAVREEFGLPTEAFLFGTVANFRPQKDYPNLLRAFRLVSDRRPSARLVAVGHGPEEELVRKIRSDLDLGDLVVLTGLRDDAVRILSACNAFVLASAWEGLPVAAMEATAIGLPIVSTAVGGMREEFTHDQSALLVPPGDPVALADAMTAVIDDDDLRHQLARSAEVLAENFDISRSVQSIEETYRQLVT